MTVPVWRRAALSVAMLLLACLIAVPLYYVVVNTFKTQGEMVASPLSLPTSPVLDNYREVLSDPRMYRSFANTLYVTVISVVLQLLVGALAAYAMVVRTSRLNRILANLLLIGFVVPGQSTLIRCTARWSASSSSTTSTAWSSCTWAGRSSATSWSRGTCGRCRSR